MASEARRGKSRDHGAALAPLVQALAQGRVLRLVARPGQVHVDAATGSTVASLRWEEAEHHAALAALPEPATLADGITAVASAGALLLRRPPDPARRPADLVREGALSQLAADLLEAALTHGRNVLVAGPWCAGVELVAALLAGGQRPAVVAAPADAVPPPWLRADTAADALACGADRVGVWSTHSPLRLQALRAASGVAAWIEARRLDRALLRFEAEAEQAGGASAPLHVLAAIDLVVVMAGARVREVAEIELVDNGYRPRLLFASGLPPVPDALVPVAPPTFLAELTQAGFRVLADELAHIGGGRRQERTEAPTVPLPKRAGPVAAPAFDAPPVPIDPALADAPPPGWELDRLAHEPGEVGEGAVSAEDAELAASFGLGPPPPPPGVASIGSEARERSTFEEALRRARERAREGQE